MRPERTIESALEPAAPGSANLTFGRSPPAAMQVVVTVA